MAYKFFVDGNILPVTPSKLTLKIGNNNKTLSLINDSEVNMLKEPGLTEISFSCLLPQNKYSFAAYPDSFRPAEYYTDLFERLKTEARPFRFVITREKPDGEPLFNTDIKVSLEDYSLIEDSEKYGFDINVDIKLKQYRSYATKELELFQETQHNGTIVTMGVITMRRDSDKEAVRRYNVQVGDALYTIAKAVYGDSEKYIDIYEANKELLDEANAKIGQTKYMIHPGQELTIP